MPPRPYPSPEARRARCYRDRQRQRETPLYTAGYTPLHVAEWLVEEGQLLPQDATDPRALCAALVMAVERYVKKNRTP